MSDSENNEAIQKNEVDCHDSALAESRNDESLLLRHTERSEVSKSRESKLWANQCHKSESK